MSVSINIVAQRCQDIFYADYKSATDFFDLDDFIANTAYSIGVILNQEYKDLYSQYRSEKKDEVIGFDASWLNKQTVEVKKNNAGELIATLTNPIMSFSYDNNTTGIQNVFCTDPRPRFELERLTRNQLWQATYWPITSRVFFVPEKMQVEVISKAGCNAKELDIYYVPAVGTDMDVPDGLVDPAITATIAKIRSLDENLVHKKSLDNNRNSVLQTEIDKAQLK